MQYPYEQTNYYLGIYVMLGVLALLSLVISCWSVLLRTARLDDRLIMVMQAIDHNHGTQVRREVSLGTAQYCA